MKENEKALWLQETSLYAWQILCRDMSEEANEDQEETRRMAYAFLYLSKIMRDKDFLENLTTIEHETIH